MVKRKLKLAQIVCAVYSLNKPLGASKREILRFCKTRFGVTCHYKEFDRILERCLDEGVLTSFKKRYRVTKLRCGILFPNPKSGKDYIRKKPISKRKKRTKAVVKHKQTVKASKKNFCRRAGISKISFKITKSLYELWCRKKLADEVDRVTELKNTPITMRTKSNCRKRSTSKTGLTRSRKSKSKKSLTRSKSRLLRLKSLRSYTSKRKQQHKTPRSSLKNKRQSKVKGSRSKQQLKVGLKSRLRHRRHQKKENSVKSVNKEKIKGGKERKSEIKERKSENSGNEAKQNGNYDQNDQGNGSARSNDSDDSLAEGQKREFHRTLLRQTKNAVVHARSWDRLNYSRQRRQRENDELVRHSQLVQKILTQSHAASWDKLNDQLKMMKELAGGCSQSRDAKGDARS